MDIYKQKVLALWNTQENIDAYDAFCSRFNYYPAAAKKLVEVAGIGQGQFVADLGCGTGISSMEAAAKVGENGRVTGFEPASLMLQRANKNKTFSNIDFVMGDAFNIYKPDNGFDAVISNSVIWLEFRLTEALKNIKDVLSDTGAFVFTMPAEYAGEVEHMMTKNAIRFWTHVQNAKVRLNLKPPSANEYPVRDFSIKAWESRLKGVGFQKVEVNRFFYQLTLEELLEHLSLPAILNSLIPTADEIDKFNFVEMVRNQISLNAKVERRWLIFKAY